MNKTQASAQQVQPYLFFDGKCEEAIEFYKSALDAKVDLLMRFKESPDPVPPGMCGPNSDDKVMHSAFRIGETFFSPRFGMVADKFGVGWMVIVPQEM